MGAVVRGIFVVFVLAVGFTMIAMDCGRSYAADPIVIGVPIPRASVYGQDSEKCITLAAEQFNAVGGIKVGKEMRPIKLEIVDTRDEEPGVPTSEVLLGIEKLILEKKVHVLIGGPIMSECAMAGLDLIPKYKIVHINSAGGLSPAWHQKTSSNISLYKYSFKVNTNTLNMVNKYADFLNGVKKQYGFDKMYVSVAEAAHTKAAAGLVEKKAVEIGWKIIGKEVHPLGTTDYSMLMRDVRKSGAQVLFIWDHTPEALNMIKQWYDLKIPALALGYIDSIFDPRLWEQTGGKCAYVTQVEIAGITSSDSDLTPATRPYLDAYKKRWGGEPRSGSDTLSYMGMQALKDAIERAGTLDSDALVKALEETNIVTVSGRLRFDKSRHDVIISDNPAEGIAEVLNQWQNGKRVGIWPEGITRTKCQFPPWMKK